MPKVAVMALSGGMDSTSLLMRLLADGYEVNAISYNYGQKHLIEVQRAQANLTYLAKNGYNVEEKRCYRSIPALFIYCCMHGDHII